jgi:hypothetical protein
MLEPRFVMSSGATLFCVSIFADETYGLDGSCHDPARRNSGPGPGLSKGVAVEAPRHDVALLQQIVDLLGDVCDPKRPVKQTVTSFCME